MADPLGGAPLRVLILEDTPERQQALTSLYKAHAWMLAETGRRAATLLSAYDFDIVSLDYNLKGELTGADVAEALATSRNREARVVIHSQNPLGAERMVRLLPNAVLYPVSRMIKTNRHFKQLEAGVNALGAQFDWRP